MKSCGIQSQFSVCAIETFDLRQIGKELSMKNCKRENKEKFKLVEVFFNEARK